MTDAVDPEATPLSVHTPNGTTRGAVIVLHEAFGVNDHIEDVCGRIADAGYVAIAPHLFHRTGDPKLGYDDFSKVAPHFAGLTPETVMADIDAALAHASGAGFAPSATGVVGFCMGGTLALVTAVERSVGAAVTFYGGGVAAGRFGFPSLVELAPRLTVPWLGLYGDLDTGIPVDDVEALRAAAATSSAATEIVRYPNAEHGFNCDRRPSFHAESAADAWQRMLEFFAANLG
ncbi:MAG: carboxymethylenebutenolidase [Acidimicrobiales bacterium]|nr:carboxymethylenebutenolidase [Acidimicrobiales bacterium]